MEFCDGGSLDALVREYADRGEYPPLHLVANLFRQVAAALHYIHFEKRLVHRDIKLENFILQRRDPYPVVKLCDFGFGRALAARMETFKGTPLFVAPQILDQTPYTSKADLYSLGVCLYRLATAQFPFSEVSDTFYREMRAHKPAAFPAPFAGDPAYAPVCDLTLRLMAYDETDRLSWEELYRHPFVTTELN